MIAVLLSRGRLGLAVLALGVGFAVESAAADGDLTDRLAACAACHGELGRSTDEQYYPSIAGKPAGYLFSQLQNFRDGRRHHPVMGPMLAYLADDYLREIADFYAEQRAVWARRGLVTSKHMLQRGQALVSAGDPALGVPACTACHGRSLAGVEPLIPGLLGLRSEYLAAQLGAWRNGVRRAAVPDCMAEIARRLSPEDISAVAGWIAAQPRPRDYVPALTSAPLPMDCGALP